MYVTQKNYRIIINTATEKLLLFPKQYGSSQMYFSGMQPKSYSRIRKYLMNSPTTNIFSNQIQKFASIYINQKL